MRARVRAAATRPAAGPRGRRRRARHAVVVEVDGRVRETLHLEEVDVLVGAPPVLPHPTVVPEGGRG